MRVPTIARPHEARRGKLDDTDVRTVQDLHLLMAGFGVSEGDCKDACARLAELLGPTMWQLLCMAVYADRGMEECEAALGLPNRSAKAVLKIALDRARYHLDQEG